MYKLINTNNKDVNKIKNILLNEGYDFIYTYQDSPNTFYDWHTHSNYKFRWVYEGEVTIGIKVDDKIIVLNLKPGDKLEIPPNTLHYAKTKTGVKYVCASK